ncbi:hypothetical protein MHYP_G00093580 [Metynnis hypsauchen]
MRPNVFHNYKEEKKLRERKETPQCCFTNQGWNNGYVFRSDCQLLAVDSSCTRHMDDWMFLSGLTRLVHKLQVNSDCQLLAVDSSCTRHMEDWMFLIGLTRLVHKLQVNRTPPVTRHHQR